MSHNITFIDVIGAIYHIALNQNWNVNCLVSWHVLYFIEQINIIYMRPLNEVDITCDCITKYKIKCSVMLCCLSCWYSFKEIWIYKYKINDVFDSVFPNHTFCFLSDDHQISGCKWNFCNSLKEVRFIFLARLTAQWWVYRIGRPPS